MTTLALIQSQIKKQQKIKNHAFVRWSLALEQANATTKAMGATIREAQAK